MQIKRNVLNIAGGIFLALFVWMQIAMFWMRLEIRSDLREVERIQQSWNAIEP